MIQVNRRHFLATLAATAASSNCLPGNELQKIDVHTHFYDPTRSEGVDWPNPKDQLLYKPYLPADFTKVAAPHQVAQTVVVEASPRIDDNFWLLKLAEKNSNILSIVGRLPVGGEQFTAPLQKLKNQPKFVGIRQNAGEIKRVWETRLAKQHLLLLIDHQISLDLNGGLDCLHMAKELGTIFPKLRIIVNHVGNVRIDGKSPPADWVKAIDGLTDLPNVACKISALVEGSGKSDGTAPTEMKYYHGVISHVVDRFGENRIMFGSNWPVCLRFASYKTVHNIVDQFMQGQCERCQALFFRENALKWYQKP
ncbi:MAG: amidohydrolase family protein [Zavarzinella sp.]